MVAGVAAARGGGWVYTYSGVPAPDGGSNCPAPTVGAGLVTGLRGWCHVTSSEYSAVPFSASMTLKQLLVWF